MIRKLLFWLLLALTPAGATPRQKIGVALAGGSARGLAHVGVLQWFEEHHIPVDCIAGTSMGGLVGAYYATGISPSEMRRMMHEVDWAGVLRGTPTFRNLSFRRKEDRRAFPDGLELGLRHGIKLPIGVSSGHQIGMIVDRLALPYYDIRSFDDLPIPFRCVATDIIAAKSVVFKDGSLSDALRATMAIPGVFSPVEIDGKWCVDGGILNNLPVDVVREMGADIVIAVQLGKPTVKPEAVQSFLGMVDRSVDLMILENENRNLRQADIVLAVNADKFGSADFTMGEEIADAGYETVEKKAAVLKGLALDDESWHQYTELRRSKVRTALPAPQFVEVSGTRIEANQAIAHGLTFAVGKPVDRARLESDFARITGWGRYDSLGYRAFRAGGQDGLQVRVREKLHGPPFLNLGVEVNVSDLDSVQFNVNGRLTFFDIGGFGSEWRNDISLGSRTVLGSEYYRPIGEHGWFVAPHLVHQRIESNLYQDRSKVAEFLTTNSTAALDLGYNFGRFSELRTGYDIGHEQSSVRVGDPLLPGVSGTLSLASLRWTYDGLDSAMIPRKGLGIRSELNWVVASAGAPEPFPRMQVETRYFQPVRQKSSVFLVASGGTTFGSEASQTLKFTLGGPLRLSALGLDEIRTNQYVYGAAGFLREIFSFPPLVGGKIYAAGWYELGKAYQVPDYTGLNNSASAGVAADTVLGPMFLGGSFGEGGRRKFYFLLGRLF
jgi:NTE family protein